MSVFKPSKEEFKALAKQGNLIPVYTEIISDCETPVSAFNKLDDGSYTFLLESAEHIDEGGRYSLVGSRPRVIFQSRDRLISVTEGGQTREFETSDDPLTELQRLMSAYKPVPMEGQLRFSGGAVGYMAYDMVRFFEPSVGMPPQDDLQLPESVFMITGSVLSFDHKLRRLRVISNAYTEDRDLEEAYEEAVAEIQTVMQRLSRPATLPAVGTLQAPIAPKPLSNTLPEEYKAMVQGAQEFIHAGDIFQIVPSQRFEATYSGDALTLYRSLRFVNPSPYMFCLKFGGEFDLVGSSPEVHVRSIQGRVEIRPIAGTRRRGQTEDEDNKNAHDLFADPKERAEHVMLVDLARNDVGRIANFGSVSVTDFMKIERYSHVMHIVSNVVGQLKEGKNAYDVMRATFPAGTVSGSPKVRAMQILNRMEKNKRGTYAGAVGYFGFDGNHDSCIALRTVALKGGKAYVQAGAGVVADSTPEGEYQETVNKAMGMMQALGLASLYSSETKAYVADHR